MFVPDPASNRQKSAQNRTYEAGHIDGPRSSIVERMKETPQHIWLEISSPT